MRRKKSFWKVKNKIAYSSLAIFLILLLLLTIGNFQVKGVGDSSPLDMERAYVEMVSGEVNSTNTNHLMYLAPRDNVPLIGVMPIAYGHWITHLIKERAWRPPNRIFNQPLCYLPKRSLSLCGHCLVVFFLHLGTIKIRE